MFPRLKQRPTKVRDLAVNTPAAGGAGFQAQIINCVIERGLPIRRILVTAQMTLRVAIANFVTFGLFNLVRKFRFKVSRGGEPDTIIDISGIGLFLLNFFERGGCDALTRMAWLISQLQGGKANQIIRITWVVDCAHPRLRGEARLRSLLGNLTSDATLFMDVAGQAEICGTADPFTAGGVTVTVSVEREEMPESAQLAMISSGAFLFWELSESANQIASGSANQPFEWDVPYGGEYTSIVTWMLQGGASLSIADISTDQAIGSETQWRLHVGSRTREEFLMREKLVENQIDYSAVPHAFDPTDAAYAADNWASPNPGGALSGVGGIQAPPIVFHDFFCQTGDGPECFGPALNNNWQSPATTWQIGGRVTTTAGAVSAQFVGAYRRFVPPSDLTSLKRFGDVINANK